MNTNDSKESDALNFDEFLDTVDNGPLGDELLERLRNVVSRVRETGRKGNVQLKLDVELAGARQVEITPSLKSKEPKTQHTKRLFYSDDEGHVYRSDPDQMDLPLRRPDGSDKQTAESVQNN